MLLRQVQRRSHFLKDLGRRSESGHFFGSQRKVEYALDACPPYHGGNSDADVIDSHIVLN